MSKKDDLNMLSPVSPKFMELILQYCDKDNFIVKTICGNTYLKRIAELGAMDLGGFCSYINYVFFAGNNYLTPDRCGDYNVDEIVGIIKSNSALGSILND